MKKGLARLIFFFIFLIPVAWYLILQLFGDNNFSLERVSEIPSVCGSFQVITVVVQNDSLSLADTNYLNRVSYGVEKRKSTLVRKGDDFFECIQQVGADMVLMDEEGVWGVYKLSRDGVDQLLTELDILYLQKNYGKSTYR